MASTPHPTQADQALMNKALSRALAKFDKNKPTPGSIGALSYLVQEGAVACAQARQETLDLLASGVSKFAPDLADELAKRWKEAVDKSDTALEEFLSVMRENDR